MLTRYRHILVTAVFITTLLGVGSSFAQNPADCVEDRVFIICDLQLNTTTYQINNPSLALKLVNNLGYSVQINQVAGHSLSNQSANNLGEYCVFLDEFAIEQQEPGIGEVGCNTKDSTEIDFLPVQWDGTNTALAIPPGSEIFFQGRILLEPLDDHDFEFTITAYPQASGVNAYRQPKADEIIACNGSNQWTSWNVWENTNLHDVAITGATIFARDTELDGHQVDAACIYVLDYNQSVRWSYCSNVNIRGRVDFADVTVLQGESIAAQARHSCAAGNHWDWAAYIYTYNLE